MELKEEFNLRINKKKSGIILIKNKKDLLNGEKDV